MRKRVDKGGDHRREDVGEHGSDKPIDVPRGCVEFEVCAEIYASSALALSWGLISDGLKRS